MHDGVKVVEHVVDCQQLVEREQLGHAEEEEPVVVAPQSGHLLRPAGQLLLRGLHLHRGGGGAHTSISIYRSLVFDYIIL